MSSYERLFAPIIQKLDPETAHDAAIRYLRYNPFGRNVAINDPRLSQTIWGLEFAHPVGLAAGFDKNAEVPDAVLRRGAAFVEVGTVTPKAQPGNDKPRMFRLSEDGAVINRLGFNNGGLEAYTNRLRRRREKGRGGIVGANVGKNKTSTDAVADYEVGVKAVAPHCNFLVVNVSSPNTPGLRDLQGADELKSLLIAAKAAREQATGSGNPPLLVKIAPDLSGTQIADIAEVVLELKIDGVIATNTTIDRPDSLTSPLAAEAGGLSGQPLFESSTKVLHDLYNRTGGRIPLIGVGGVGSADDAYSKIKAGASLVQLYSAMTFQGLGIFAGIARGLSERLKADGYDNVADAVGADHR